jgi:uncharacterized repeat protein (TIGR01451 family)
LAVFTTLVALAPSASAVETIASAGPLDEIIIGDALECQVSHIDDTDFEFFPPASTVGACNTQIRIGGTTYGPPAVPAGNVPTPYTPVSQSAITGTGTSADPFTVVTEVAAGQTGISLIETDSYVIGEERYRTDVEIVNGQDVNQDVIVYRAGDCFLNNSDDGFGASAPVADGTAVSCIGSDDGTTPNNRVETWIPLTAGSHWVEDFFSDVWTMIANGTPFPDTCDCDTFQDNGAGLSWELTIPASGSETVSHLTVFSPDNVVGVTKTADAASSAPGARNGYTITVANNTAGDIELDTIVDTLPAGFAYVSGSTTQASTDNPSVSGQVLTWDGPFPIPAGDSITLHFDVTVSSTPGTYFNQATATGVGFTVAGTGDTAPITVTAAQVPLTPAPTAVRATPAFTG